MAQILHKDFLVNQAGARAVGVFELPPDSRKPTFKTYYTPQVEDDSSDADLDGIKIPKLGASNIPTKTGTGFV